MSLPDHDDDRTLSLTLDGHAALVRHSYGPAAGLLVDGDGRPSGVVAAVSDLDHDTELDFATQQRGAR